MEGKKRVTLALVIGIILLLILIAIIFVYYITLTPPTSALNLTSPFVMSQIDSVIIDENHVYFLLVSIGALSLHNPPLSGETPKIEIKVDEDVFWAEVYNRNLSVKRGAIAKPDIRISTTRSEVIDAVKAPDMKAYFQKSVEGGNSKFELLASYTKLFSKGYLGLYKEATGKSFTGGVIKIFEQG